MKHFKTEGPCQRRKKSGGRKNNTKSLSTDDTNRVYQLIKNYAEYLASRWMISCFCHHQLQRAKCIDSSLPKFSCLTCLISLEEFIFLTGENGDPFCSSCCCLFLVDFAFLPTFVFDVTMYYTGNIYTDQ